MVPAGGRNFLTHRHRLAPGLHSRYPRAELARRLRDADLVAVDIDECIFPGFSQSWLGHLIMWQLVRRPDRLRDLRYIPQLLSGGAYIRRVDLQRRLWRAPSNRSMMARYVRSMRGIPELYFRRGAGWIPDRSYDGVRAALTLLGRRAPLGLISLGIHLIAEAYQAWLDRGVVDFTEANRVAFAPAADGRPGFADYEPPLRTGRRDKLRALERRLAQHGARRPVVIGNGPDDGAMAERAGELGGLAVGFRPRPAASRRCFDVVVTAPDWRPLAALLREALG